MVALAEVMSKEVVTLPPDSTVSDAARVMVRGGFGSVVIVQGRMLLGILTERDVLRAAAEEDDLRAHLADRLVRYKVPRTFEFVEDPLKDDAGKVRRRALREARVPDGAFYVLADARSFGADSRDLAEVLLERARVGTTPGIDFGPEAEGMLRFCYAVEEEAIEEALSRLEPVLKALRADTQRKSEREEER